MPHVLIASDAPWVHDDLRAALPGRDHTVQSLAAGRAVLAAVQERTPDLLVLDMHTGNMGGMAVSLELRNEETGGRLPHIPILLLLDRQADVFLARRSLVEGWLVKPMDPLRIRRAVTAILGGDTYEDRTQAGDASNNYRPTPDATAR